MIAGIDLVSDDASELELDSLPRSIAELREEIVQWIDRAIVQLRQRQVDQLLGQEEVTGGGTPDRSTLQHEPRLGPRPPRVGESLRPAGFESAASWEAGREGSMRGAGVPEETRFARAPADRAAEAIDGSAQRQVPARDPRERLDALARLLDNRLEKTRAPSACAEEPRREPKESSG
jgi:hypothetical protein